MQTSFARVPVRLGSLFAGLICLCLAVLALARPSAAEPFPVHRAMTVAWSRVETAAVSGEPVMQTAHFAIYYPGGREDDARIVAQELERYYPEVTSHLGALPPGRLPVRVETTAGMTAVFGGPEAPIGAYWRGVLWFLAPGDWGARSDYGSIGPVPHELAHAVDDYRDGGRLPGWLDEGVAQFEEWRDNGYVWLEAANDLRLQHPYTWAQLQDEFDALPDQALAYRQAFLVVKSLGPAGVDRLLSVIASGKNADQALAQVVGGYEYRALVAGAAWQEARGGAAN